MRISGRCHAVMTSASTVVAASGDIALNSFGRA